MTYSNSDAQQEIDIDLSAVKVISGSRGKPGYHVGTASKAETSIGGTGARQIKLQYQTPDGTVFDRITYFHPKAASDPGAKKAVEIGLRKLKSLLSMATPPAGEQAYDANRFRGVRSLLGLTVGLLATQGDDYVKNNELVQGAIEVISKGRPYYKASEIPTMAVANERLQASASRPVVPVQSQVNGNHRAPF